MLVKVNLKFWYVLCMNKKKYIKSVLKNCNVLFMFCFMFEFLLFVIFYCFVCVCINNMKMILW